MAGKAIHGRLTGTSAGTRVYPLVLPQNPVLPAVTYRVLSTTATHLFGTDADVEAVRVQVDCWATSYSAVRALAAEVSAALNRYSGTVNGIVVRDVLLQTELDLHEEDTGLRRVLQDFIIYLEA